MPGTLDPPLGPDDHVAGDDGAPYELVMYGDFEVPVLRRRPVDPRPPAREAGRRAALRPGTSRSTGCTRARHAAEASEAAAAQGAFWPMHDALYAARGRLTDRDLASHAAGLGLDGERVAAELASHVHAPRVDADLESARRAGLSGTPAFFVNGRLYADTYDAGSLAAALRG